MSGHIFFRSTQKTSDFDRDSCPGDNEYSGSFAIMASGFSGTDTLRVLGKSFFGYDFCLVGFSALRTWMLSGMDYYEKASKRLNNSKRPNKSFYFQENGTKRPKVNIAEPVYFN